MSGIVTVLGIMRAETPSPAPREEINSWRDDSEAVRTESWFASGSKTADCAVRTSTKSSCLRSQTFWLSSELAESQIFHQMVEMPRSPPQQNKLNLGISKNAKQTKVSVFPSQQGHTWPKTPPEYQKWTITLKLNNFGQNGPSSSQRGHGSGKKTF